MALAQDHMNISVPPEGDETLTAHPYAAETIDDLEDREREKLTNLINRVNNATSEEELDGLLEEYLDGHVH